MSLINKNIKRLLIANRGEIACRIIRTCRKMGIETVAVFSDADKNALHVQMADFAAYIGESEVNKSYLNAAKIIAAAVNLGADAIHPGYGFMSENATFARKVADAGLIFVGPNPEAIDKMGSKALAKAIAEEHKVPVIPGYKGKDQSLEKLREEALKIGFPLLIKASAGGGGKGMKIVNTEAELENAIASAQREALSAFGDSEILMERYLPSSRHIEIQIFGDKHGNVIHLLERECTIQRRYQKIFEESPSPVLTEEKRKEMGEAAVRMAKALNYDNAGTVEFIYDNGNFYFLEVNTRLQVEHPVTEAITGLDLVEMQIQSAQGMPLAIHQDEVKSKGYALQCRLYAEDATNDFMPATGTILLWKTPNLEGLRYDTGIQSGSEISVFYDPMISKVIAHGPDRATTIRRMQNALSKTVCLGTVTNLPFLQKILSLDDFHLGYYDTNFIANKVTDKTVPLTDAQKALALIFVGISQAKNGKESRTILRELPFGWRNNFYQSQKKTFEINGEKFEVKIRDFVRFYEVEVLDKTYQVEIFSDNEILINTIRHRFEFAISGADTFVQHCDFSQIKVTQIEKFPEVSKAEEPGGYLAHIPATVVKVLVTPGNRVNNGDSLIILSSMKMENVITANEDGEVEEIYVSEGENIPAGTLLLKMKN